MGDSKPEADIIFNRANVALARSQRVISAWLPPSDEKSPGGHSAEEQQLEEEEEFTPIPEKLGLGAPLPKKEANGGHNRSELGSNHALRKKLLVNGSRTGQSQAASNVQSKEKTAQRAAEPVSQPNSESEEEGRSSLGKRKRNGPAPASGASSDRREPGHADSVKGARGSGGANRKNTYLDSLLSSRSGKKKGKGKGKGNGNGPSSTHGK